MGVKAPSFPCCVSCRDLRPSPYGPDRFFGALVPNPSSFYSAFKYYKSIRGESGARYREMIAAALSGAHELHATAIETVLGGSPTHVCPVPSTRVSPTEQTLLTVTRTVASLAEAAAPAPLTSRSKRIPWTVQRDLFQLTEEVSACRILLVEDLWVRGSTAESAAAPLIAGGARVAVLAIGREVRPGFLTADTLIASLDRPRWW